MKSVSFHDFLRFIEENSLHYKVKYMFSNNIHFMYYSENGTVLFNSELQESDSESVGIFNERLKPFVNSESNFMVKTPFDSKKLEDGSKLYRRKHGESAIVEAGKTEAIVFTVPYENCKIDKIEIINANMMDSIDLLILDKEINPIYGYPSYPLNQFGFNVFVSDFLYSDKSNYDADLIKDFQVLIVYRNNGLEAANVGINLVLHEVK